MGKIIGIQITSDGEGKLASVNQVKAVAGQGLEGDRYFNRTGTYSKKHKPSREGNLYRGGGAGGVAARIRIGIEPVGKPPQHHHARVALNHLVGKAFRVGEAAFQGLELCEPCGHLEQLTGRQVRAGLVHRGGLRTQILETGIVRVGDFDPSY